MIALALACNPEVLIADEPTTALDVTVQAQILDLIRGLQKELGMGVVMITHDLGVVAESCDRIVVMYAGRKVEDASVFDQIGRASCRARVCQYVKISVVAVSLKKKDNKKNNETLYI